MRLIDVFEKEVECDYRGEHYSVRDNGAIFRHKKEGSKIRPNDEVWTFGVLIPSKGYTTIGKESVHRIVAVAFIGEPPSPQHVVDHIDTNRQNNRPSNLRWVTRLENAMLNDITRRKLEWICGCSIEEIVNNWSLIRDKNLPPNIAWMKAVTKEEAEQSLITWRKWAESLSQRKEIDRATTMYFKYKNGPHSMVYPLEPIGGDLSLEEYNNNLKLGKRFCYRDYVYGRNQYVRYGFRIIDFFYNKDTSTLSVATESEDGGGVKNLFFTKVAIENNEFVYTTKSCFSPISIEKYMTLARGEEWTGGDVIDDYC